LSERDQQLAIAFYADETSPSAAPITMTWGELIDTLTEDRPSPCTVIDCAGKKCPYKSCTASDNLGAWSPVELSTPYRLNDNVESIHVLALDGDGITVEQLERLNQALQGASYVVHTTHRHRGGERFFVRAVVQLSRPVPAAQWRDFYRTAITLLGLADFIDTTCKDLARLYFLPTHPTDAPFLSDVGDGEPLNVDEVLSRSLSVEINQQAGLKPVAETDHLDPAPDATTEPFTNLGALVKSLRSYRRDRSHRATSVDKEKADLIGRLIEGKPLAAPGGNADPTPIAPPEDLPKGRGYAIARVARICTGYLPANTPDEAYLQIFAGSLDAMCFGRLSDREEMEEHLLEKLRIGRDERAKWEEERAARNTVTKTYLNAVAEERNKSRTVAQADNAVIEAEFTEVKTEPVEPDAWMDSLQTSKNGEGLLDRSLNAHLILKNASEFKGCFRWNDVDLRIDVFGIFQGVEQEVLDVHVANYLALKWGLHLKPETILRQITLLAFENRYDPIKDYLRSLKWDGATRVDNWLKVYARAGGDSDEATTAMMGRKWIIGAVARGLNPGVKMDLVLVLEGEQGTRKTSLLEALGGAWYADLAIAIGDKDSKMIAARSWISELPELAALKRKGEQNAIKAFFTNRVDKFRPPFGRAVIESPRRNVFAGTTNDYEYLADATGNRRYLCVRCGEVDLAAFKRDRDQILAEAVHLYDKHVNECSDKLKCGCWWLVDEEVKQAEALAEQRMEDSPHEMAIMEWWTGLEPSTRPAELQTNMVAKNALQYSQDRVTSKVLADIGAALTKLGFTKRRAQEDGKRRRYYVPSDELLALPQSAEGKRKSMSFKPALKSVP
jgi:hypothetical protein